jgi:hypothetical protein
MSLALPSSTASASKELVPLGLGFQNLVHVHTAEGRRIIAAALGGFQQRLALGVVCL